MFGKHTQDFMTLFVQARLCEHGVQVDSQSIRSISFISTVVNSADEVSNIYKEFSRKCYYQSDYSGGWADRKERWQLWNPVFEKFLDVLNVTWNSCPNLLFKSFFLQKISSLTTQRIFKVKKIKGQTGSRLMYAEKEGVEGGKERRNGGRAIGGREVGGR